MDFYVKTGNDPFSPIITVNSILLDNTIDTELEGAVGAPDTTTRKKITNSITANFTISSKQNSLDYWIADADYLNYVKVFFYILESKSQVDNLIIAAEKGIAYINLYNIIQNPIYKVVSLSEIVDLSEITKMEYTFSTEQMFVFSGIEEEKDIILVAMPYIDFDSYFSDNGIDQTIGQQLVTTFYNIETYQYNVLINGNTINDKISRKVLTDVRQLKELKSNILSLLPPTVKTPFTEDKVSYLSDVFTSFNYGSSKIENYFFFNVKEFIQNNCAIKKIFNNLTLNELERTLITNKSIFFEIYRNDEEEEICSFSCSTRRVVDTTKTVSVVAELTNDEVMCILFTDDFPTTRQASFQYKIKVSFSDPFVKRYYDDSGSSGSGLFFKTMADLSIIQTFVDDPRNSDSNTTKFTKINNSNVPETPRTELISNFFKMYNLFTRKEVTKKNIDLISTALQFERTTIIAFNDFLSFVNQNMTQMEDFFMSYGNSITEYSKTTKKIKADLKDYYFSRDPVATNYNTIKYYNDGNEYDLLSSSLDSKNPASYKIINSVLNLTEQQYSYLPEYDCISGLLELDGTVIYKNTEFETTKIKSKTASLFNNSNASNTDVDRISDDSIDAKKQYGFYKITTDNLSIKNITNFISSSAKEQNTETMMKFELYFLDDMNENFLIPKIDTLVYNIKTKQWQNLNSINKGKTNVAYLAKTIYSRQKNKKNIYSHNSVIPPINEEYFVLEIKSGNVTAKTKPAKSTTPTGL